MTTHHIAVPALSFNGVEIHARNEMLSLTDMWKAAGADPARRPAEWLRGEQAKRFILFMAEDLGMGEVGKSHFGLVRGARGGEAGGATFAHWQVAMAYAKYLSPEFHMWCNTVVRERMEGKPAQAAMVLTEDTKAILGNMIKNCTGLVVREYLAQVVPAMVEGALLEGGHVVSTDYKPALDVLKEKKVPAKRRRSFSQKCSARLRRFALSSKRPPRLSRETGRYLFHVDTIRDWLEQEGNALISSHVSSLTGQAVLPFKKK